MVARGVVGIVTDGYCRDTAEVVLQRTPICARARGRTNATGGIFYWRTFAVRKASRTRLCDSITMAATSQPQSSRQ